MAEVGGNKVYKSTHTIKLPNEMSTGLTDKLSKINETSADKKLKAQQRVAKSVFKATVRTGAIQLLSEYVMSTINHNIKMVGLRDGDTYKQQQQQLSMKYLNVGANAIRSAASAFLVSGGLANPAAPLIALGVAGVTAVTDFAGIGIESYYAEQEAQTRRNIDSLNVNMARRALSIGSTYANRNIENKGVMY